jgi:hypothetical protein
MEFQSKPIITLPSTSDNETVKKEPIDPPSSIPILLPPAINQQTGLYELLSRKRKPIFINFRTN